MKENRAHEIVREIIKSGVDKSSPSKYVSDIFDTYKKKYPNNNSLNGAVFEEVIIQCLLTYNISPIYSQAKMSFVPNVIFDIVLYNRKTPIVLSIKTTLRERWKQADLESVAIKYVYRNSKSYLINYSEKENETRNKDENGYMGLDAFIFAGSNDFDELIYKLQDIELSANEDIPVFYKYEEYTIEDRIQ